MGFSKGLSLSVLLFCSGWVFEAIGRAIPNPDADLSGSGISIRADTSEFVTMYDLFDHVNPPASNIQINNDDSPGLRPIAVVLETMQASSVATPAVVLDQPFATASPLLAVQSSPTSANAFTSSPFRFGGPGPVILPSSVYKSLSSLGPGVDLNNSNTNVAPSKHLTVLGIIIGAMLLFTVCVFVLMSPPDLFYGCARLKRAAGKEGKEPPKEPEKALQDSSSWVTVPSPSTLGKRSSLETDNGRESERPIRDTVIDVVAALSSSESKESPTSKFSMCSSEYPPSSTYASDLASNSSTVRAMPATSTQLPDAGQAGKPIRPPRPPTTDSPALSNSVYLACSDTNLPYVIVAPQPLTDDDLLPSIPKSPRKLLTSTEFVALRLRITGKHSSLDSRHSRTRSAPALGRRNRTSWLKIDIPPAKSFFSGKSGASMKRENQKSFKGDKEVLLEDIEGDSDIQESMVRRVMKHRRSRSASGWAYPSKGRRTRLPFKLEEE